MKERCGGVVVESVSVGTVSVGVAEGTRGRSSWIPVAMFCVNCVNWSSGER